MAIVTRNHTTPGDFWPTPEKVISEDGAKSVTLVVWKIILALLAELTKLRNAGRREARKLV